MTSVYEKGDQGDPGLLEALRGSLKPFRAPSKVSEAFLRLSESL